MTAQETHKLAKLMARRGYGSRRAAETLIRAGRVSVDGAPIDNVAMRFPADVTIAVAGMAERSAEASRLWCYHKPRGLVTTHRDERGRPTVFAALPAELGRVVSVGRLDRDSEGLLLLTNDGGWVERLGRSRVPRRYRVCVRGVPEEAMLQRIRNGVTVNGVLYAPAGVERCDGTTVRPDSCWLRMVLREGKNREIRRIMAYFGHDVVQLVREAFGPVGLGALAVGAVRPLTDDEHHALADAVRTEA